MPLPQALAAVPLSEETADAVARLVRGLDAPALWWLSGYTAGLATRAAEGDAASAVPAAAAAHADIPAAARLTIVYGSQTGNARREAERLAADAEEAGLAVRLLRADAYRPRELKSERHLWLVVSTQGDGEPSDDARELHDFIVGARAPRLEHLQYAVLGLGDSSYPQFCAIARVLDARLAELGAQRMLPRGDADLDIEPVAAPWRTQAVAAAKEFLPASAQGSAPPHADLPTKPLATVTPLRPQATASPSAFSRDSPFAAQVLANQRITAAAGGRDVRHLELSLEDAGLHYAPGDALGVRPRNPDALVDEALVALRLDGDAAATHAGRTLPLRAWLGEHRELTKLARPFLVALGQRTRDSALHTLLAPGNDTANDWIGRNQVIDALQAWPAEWAPDDIVAALRPLLPRLYSIASSRKLVGDEAHLTVAHVEYAVGAATRRGVASHLLASRAIGDTVPVYVEPNERFRLPADSGRDVIMIGPGTGIAPFRAFVQERVAVGARGRHWLFFGNPHFRSDFLYQLEWQRALKSGQLQRLDLAFSRDARASGGSAADNRSASRKVYVQHRLRERGRELYDWLQGGAHLYVCGALAMGRDVHATLRELVAMHDGGDADAADEYLATLQREGRYARDVY